MRLKAGLHLFTGVTTESAGRGDPEILQVFARVAGAHLHSLDAIHLVNQAQVNAGIAHT